MIQIHPLLILALGMAAVIAMIVKLRVNAFIALIAAAMLVSVLSPGAAVDKISRVAEAFGVTAGRIGIVIALAAVIGRCMMDSGAADRIVRMFLGTLGPKRGGLALMGSGFALSIPVFFDTVFYLLVPLARSMFQRTGRNYLLYLMAITAGGAMTHTMVPPTPGPLAVAAELNVDLGAMILIGALVAFPAALSGLLFAMWLDRRMPVPMRSIDPTDHEPQALDAQPPADDALPPLGLALLPIALPVVLISANTVLQTLAAESPQGSAMHDAAACAALFGNANLALLLAAAVAVGLYWRQRRPGAARMTAVLEHALLSGGLIILITAAGGAFGAMLQQAQIGPAIQGLFADDARATGFMLLGLAFTIASLLKIAQGSTTVAMITTAGMIAAMVPADGLGFHAVYLATAIGSGSQVGSWMNDSGFWIFTKMGGLTETEALKSWTPLLAIMSFTAFITTLILAILMPLA